MSRAEKYADLSWELLIEMAEHRQADLFPDDPHIHPASLKYAVKRLKLRKGTRRYEEVLERARLINPAFFK
ncbi:hypothetical protein K2X83_01615 [Patescibacteria group bacterium]|nr:hypothetical protein [Patescibacteria group bacterium]